MIVIIMAMYKGLYILSGQISAPSVANYETVLFQNQIFIKQYTEDVYHINHVNLAISHHCSVAVNQ